LYSAWFLQQTKKRERYFFIYRHKKHLFRYVVVDVDVVFVVAVVFVDVVEKEIESQTFFGFDSTIYK